ncbi:MAG: hypothetical protein PHU21_14215 [Elusimicrobia bacterium]|nr:hypothetical protein [Elusimicrobiota bacterium]
MASSASLLLVLAAQAWGLSAAAGKVDITPDLARHNVYLAGFGARGRRPSGVHDPLYARLLVLKEGRRTVALASLDLLGFSHDDVEDLRRLAGFGAPGRYLFVAATHVHSGPDTMGLWGPLPGLSGVDKAWMGELKKNVAAALRALEARLSEASVAGWQGTLDPRGLCRDRRDPAVIDPDLAALRFRGRDGRAVATVVNWACHPEVLGKENRIITADFPGALCAKVERDTGGACLFFNGPIGGLLIPDAAEGSSPWQESERIGEAVAGAALRGLAKALPAARPGLSFRSLSVDVPVENSRYLLFLPALAASHRLFDIRGRPLPLWKLYGLAYQHVLRRLQWAERPWVKTEVALVDVGAGRLLGLPGEPFPELVLGGYGGKFSFGRPVLKPGNPDPPDLARAPQGPYLKNLAGRPVALFVGLANDELGYFVPEYDFKVRPNLTLTPRLPGDHYEETNSLGPSATKIVLNAARYLLSDKRSADRPHAQ